MCGPRLLLLASALFATTLGQNFSARSFSSDCGEVFTQTDFIVESLRYPSNYPLSYECSYLIKGKSCPTNFTFYFVDFNVEESLGCSKDRLEVDDQDTLCGSKNNEVRTYFSEKGTLILRFVSDGDNTARGYRILVTRSSCDPDTTTPNLPKWHTTNKDVEYTTKKYVNPQRQCCQRSYSSKQFMLVSPDFPYSMSSPTECFYEIHKTNRDVCRLRIHVRFFWLGRKNTNCPEGFLEIDGKHFCGCKSDLKIIAPFQGQRTKILRFLSRGYERSSYSGFVMDVIQDECPKKFLPDNQNATIETRFGFDNDEIKRVALPSGSHAATIEKLHLISENTEIVADDAALREKSPEIIKHFYFYSYPELSRTPRDREETEYVDTSSLTTSFIKDTVDYGQCRNWNQWQFNWLTSRKLPGCKISEGSVAEKKCIELNLPRGHFQSPGYPFYYPADINICYRFYKLPGYCTVRVYMKDFSLQESFSCENDYLLYVDKLRYCGRRLSNTLSTVDLTNKPYEEMTFVADSSYCDRGFFGFYEQIPCRDVTRPIPPSACSRTLRERAFTIDVYDYDGPTCSFVIKKYSEYVCSATLYFEKFDLMCGSESLVIDGTMYCGSLTGRSVKINVRDSDPVIVYQRSSNAGSSGLRLRIQGVQSYDDCPELEVPAERILDGKRNNTPDFRNTTQVLLKIGNTFKDICGVIVNSTETKLPDTFCDLIMKNNSNVTNCLPLTENQLIVPLESRKLELKILDAEKTEEIEFKEIDCEKLSDL